MLFGEYTLVVWKISRELTAQQQAFVDPEEQVIFVARKLDSLRSIVTRQLLNFAHRLLGQQSAIGDIQTSERNLLLGQRQAMPVGRNHHQTVVTENQQCS